VCWLEGDGHDVRKLLGQSFLAVVLDLHGGFDADVLGGAYGLVRRAGALVLRLPERSAEVRDERLALHPYTVADVGIRSWTRLAAWLDLSAVPPAPIAPALMRTEPSGTPDQARAVAILERALGGPAPVAVVLTADRGRGKSSALGLALRTLRKRKGIRIALTAQHRDAIREVLRFAGEDGEPIRVAPPLELLDGDAKLDVLVVDEAAVVPVGVLQTLVRRHAGAHIAFATTVRGYEGTGRGFLLRFVPTLDDGTRTVIPVSLDTPIRWDRDDPLEEAVIGLLALDAEPAPVTTDPAAPVVHTQLDRDVLAEDEGLLRDVVGLLGDAHYRTTPGDLVRLLDAPNLDVHVLRIENRVVAASLVAREGDLPPDLRARMADGRMRVRGHALADTLATHSGRVDAAGLLMVRSIRIAVHPEHRGRGLGHRLVDAVHLTYAPDLFGTMFGATTELLRFRRSCGYELVRIGSARGARTGLPAAVMVRALSSAARDLVADLRAVLARDLPAQLALLDAEGPPLDSELRAALHHDLPAPAELAPAACHAMMTEYAAGTRPYEAAVTAIALLLAAHPAAVDALDPASRALVRSKVVERRSWRWIATHVTGTTVPATMRALRQAIVHALQVS